MAREAVEDGEDAAEFFGFGDGRMAGAGGFGADVEEVGAVGLEVQGLVQGGGGVEEAAAIGEGVGGEVEDAHQAGRRQGTGFRVQGGRSGTIGT